MEESNLPLWKRMAIEKGVMMDPSDNQVPIPEDVNGKKEERKVAGATRPVRIRESTISLLKDYGMLRHFRTGEPLGQIADIIDLLVSEAMQSYGETLEALRHSMKK